jgi:hypothetical protein
MDVYELYGAYISALYLGLTEQSTCMLDLGPLPRDLQLGRDSCHSPESTPPSVQYTTRVDSVAGHAAVFSSLRYPLECSPATHNFFSSFR